MLESDHEPDRAVWRLPPHRLAEYAEAGTRACLRNGEGSRAGSKDAVGELCPEAIMRFMICAAGLMLAFVGSFEVGAQTSTSPTTGQTARSTAVRPAPIGHRQPTLESVQHAEGLKGDSPKPQQRAVDLDRSLVICRGC